MNRKTRWAVVLWVFAAWCSTGPYAGTTLLTPEQTANIKALVAAGKQPWKQGYDEFIAKADAHLGITPLSVTYQGDTGHILISQSPYDWSNNMANSPCGASYCDGQKNPLADNADATAIATLCKAVRDLGIAYAFTNDSKYADKAVSLIYTWFLAPATYMEPWVPDSPSWAQEINVCNISLHNAYCGASLIWDYAGWPAQQRSAFIDWVNEFAGIMKILGPYGGNWESWRLLTLSSGAACVGNATDLAYAFDTWKSGLPTRMNTSGAWVSDLSRTNSLFYSMYSMFPMTMVAQIASHNGTDLFGYSVDGRSLELAWDYYAPYVLDPSSWPYQQISPYSFGKDLYEIAYAVKQKTAYQSVLDAIDRPFYNKDVGGPTTLLFAWRGDEEPMPDTIPPSLTGASADDAVSVTVRFSETVEKVSAENTSNYAIDNGITVSSAVLEADTRTVTLDVAALVPGTDYTLTVNNIKDRAATPNTIAANSTVPFTYTNCLTSSSTWSYRSLETQTGTFAVTFTATPNDTLVDALTALSNGSGLTFTDYAVIVRFHNDGNIDVRNGGVYQADSVLAYAAGTAYRFRVEVDVPSRRYSVYVTPEGSSEIRIATDYAFRSEQSTVSALNSWGVWSDPGTHTVCDFQLEPSTGMALPEPRQPGFHDASVRIYDPQGRLIGSFILGTGGTERLRKVPGVGNGVYFLKAADSGASTVKTILLMK